MYKRTHRAFNACAASQGCMNNITFGDDIVGYYETVAGGAGAVSITITSITILYCINHIVLYITSL